MSYEEDNKLLLNDLKTGDKKAIVFVYEYYRKMLTVAAITILKDDEAAKDLVQQFYIDFFEHNLYLKIKAPFTIKSYLFSCIRNRSINKLRDDKRMNKRMAGAFHQLLEELPAAEPGKSELEDKSDLESGEKTLKQLDAAFWQTYQQVPTSAKTLELRYIDGLSREEIAERMGISVNTVKNNLKRALKTLRSNFKPNYNK